MYIIGRLFPVLVLRWGLPIETVFPTSPERMREGLLLFYNIVIVRIDGSRFRVIDRS